MGNCTRRGIALEAALEAALALEAAQAGKCIKWGIINKEFRLYRGMRKEFALWDDKECCLFACVRCIRQ